MSTTTDASLDRAQFARDWEEWHRAHEERRADPHGFLAVAALYWIPEDSASLPGIPGRWSTSSDGPVVELATGESLEVNGTTVTGRHAFGPIPERGGATVGFDRARRSSTG